MAVRYYISLNNPALARGADPELAFSAHGASEFAAQLQRALREDGLFQRWRARQDDPDGVDPTMGATDPEATVLGEADDLHVKLVVVTCLPGDIIKHRMRLLAGNAWELRDVAAA